VGLADTTFGPIPGPLVRQWGIDVVLIKGGGPGVYDPTTGSVIATERRIPLKGVLLAANAKEWEGLYQQGDQQLVVDPDALQPEGVTTNDSVEFLENGVTVHWKVVESKSYRGDRRIVDFSLVRRQ
jgi:hypothetical protein